MTRNRANRIVVIGGVAAGPKAAARARRRDPRAEITIVERGGLLSYAGCGLPFFVEGLIDDVDELMSTPAGVVRDGAFFADVKGIRVLTRTEAVAIDREAKTVRVRSVAVGTESDLPYDHLVLATGAAAIRPPVEGIDLWNVFQLHHPSDAVALHEALEDGRVQKVAVVGGGLIGLETASALVARGLQVTVLEMQDHLLGPLLDTEMAAYLERRLHRRLDLRFGARVLRLEGDEQGRVARVHTTDGTFDAEVVVAAVGVRPNVQLARDASLEIGSTGAIKVDDRLRTSDPSIYAGGDCVESVHLVTGDPCYVPLGSTANKHGRVIGDNVTGGDTRFSGVAGTTVLRALDVNVARTGLTERQARELGIDAVTALVPGHDRAHYHPSAERLVVKLVARRDDGRLLGGQAIGPGEAAKRVDVLATALAHGATVEDLADYDLGYAPPLNAAVDVLAQAANVIRNKREGLVQTIEAEELRSRLDAGDEVLVLDVRERDEVAMRALDVPRLVNIPLGELRRRASELGSDQGIVVVCAAGVRGYDAARQLEGAGIGGVSVLEGGLEMWPSFTRQSQTLSAC